MTENRKPVRGAGGGGKSGDEGAHAVEATDSLHSKQFAKVLDLIAEGPISGLVDGVNSVYLNETPLATAGVFNFDDVGVNWTTGTQQQLTTAGAQALASEYGFDAVRYQNAVGVVVLHATPVVRSLSNANVDTIIVTVLVPSLLSRDASNGNTNPSSVSLTIDVQSAGGGYVNRITDTITGKTTTKYQRSYAIAVSGPGQWDIRVTKTSSDSTSQLLENTLYFDDYTGVITTRLTYPNSALVAASIDSQQFQTVPSRAYDIKGLLVKIPSNYNPLTRVYTGTWNGTFSIAWTDNPAWCFYDLVTNNRYGLGDFIDASQVDKWGLYAIAQYCDALVPSGIGAATEPRFTCNLYLQSPEEAYTVIQNMASIFRAITFWSTGSITVVQDTPQSPIALFTNANVIDGAFNYTGASIKVRHTVAQVTWNDPADFYRQKIEYVQDDDGVRLYGVKRADIVAFGCTSRGQANRLGKWLLYTDKQETETVTFRAGLDGFQLYPGAVFKTTDANRAGQRMGGRVVSATTTTVTLDAPVTIATGKTYTLSIIEPDGTVVKAAVTNALGQQTTLTIPVQAQAPQANAAFIFEANDLVGETWRIVGVSQPEHHIVEVTALKHDITKFAQIELGQKFDPPIISSIAGRPDAPTNLAVRTSPYTVNGAVVGLRATFSWQSRESRFRARWRQANAIWTESTVTESTIDIDNIDYTAYEFQVYAISQIGRESDAAILNQTITVPAVVLPALTGLALEVAFTAKDCKIKWDACAGATSYRVEVRDTATGTTRRIVNVGPALRFEYTSADTRLDGGPWRALTFYVTPLGQFGSASALAGTLAVSNPQVGAVNGLLITGGVKTIFLSYTTPADLDFVGVIVWLSTDPACPTVTGNQVYVGNDSLLVFRTLADGATALVGNTNYYLKIAAYDDFGQDSLTYSGSLLAVPSANAPDAASITAAMVQAGVLDLTKFASNIAPIGLYASLPTVAGYTGPSVIYNTTDGKMYRLVAGAWTAAAAATDVTGQLTDAQLSAISAAKLTGQVGAGQIADGAIGTAKLAAGAIDATKFNGSIDPVSIVGTLPANLFMRASTGTYVDGAIMKTAVVNQPRFQNGVVLLEAAATNLLTLTERFDHASWGKQTVTITVNAATAPDGAGNACLYSATSTASAIYLPFTATVAVYTEFVYLKAGSLSSIRVDLATSAYALGSSCLFNLVAGTAGTVTNYGTTTGSTAFINSVGNGWYQCGLTVTTTATTWYLNVNSAVIGTVYIWGADAKIGALSSYIPSTETFVSRASIGTYVGSNGQMLTAAVNVARMHYNVANLAAGPSLLIEAAATNLATNSTNPALWGVYTEGTSAGTVQTVTDPVKGSVVRLTKTAGGTNDRFGIAVGVSGLSGSAFAASLQVKANNAATLGIPLYVDCARTGGGLVSASLYVFGTVGVWAPYQAIGLGPLAGTGTFYCFVYGAAGSSIDLAFPQLENGAVVTSYIPTTASVATRAADVATSTPGARAVDVDGYAAPRMVLLTTDGKLYRIDYSVPGWTAAAAAVDLTGQLTDAQLAAISSAKLIGTVGDAQLSGISTTKLVGTVAAAQIAANSITAAQIAANTITAGQIVAGTITAAQIAANTITATQIAAGTITGDRLLANTITAGQIAAGTIVTAQLAAGGVNADRIAANSITTSQMGAGSVTAAAIVAGTITTGQIAASTITGSNIAAGSVNADRLVASSITAGQIAAGAISTTQLAANAITASRLAVTGGGAALNKDPNFADFPAAWSILTGSPVYATNPGGNAPASTYVSSSGGVQCSFMSNETIAIDPAKQYRLSGYVFTESTNNRAFYLGLDLYDGSGGAHITGAGTFTVYPVSNIVAATNGYVMYSATVGAGGSVAIPSNAKVARVGAFLNYGGSVGGVMALTALRLEEVMPSTLIQDGAITTIKILAGAVTADRILANTITAAQIAANTITAAQIAAGTITANQIAAGTITAAKIASGTITATQIAAGTITADRMSVTSLSAIAANIGAVTAGDLYGTTLHGGTGYPTSTFAWPTNGGTGFHLSSSGLLMGNSALGRYFEADSNGDIYAPGLSIVSGVMTLSQANIINTLNIAGNAVTVPVGANGGGFSVTTQTTIVSVGITTSGGGVIVGYSIESNRGASGFTAIDRSLLYRDGTLIAYGNLSGVYFDSPASGSHTYRLDVTAAYDAGTCTVNTSHIFALEAKK